ncbi:hypothetical protein ACFS27_12485 [Promicromonospora vindobonensis]|uniref:Uncharacterized protein n=1 Tax=Promicromonospora vindobonensis TaxID=195748 RepID=A0ABW5VWE0_9MICO
MAATDSVGAGASVSVPSAGDALRFAAYVAELVGDDRVESVNWIADSVRPASKRLYVTVTDTMHGETVAHLLGLDVREDLEPLPGYGGRSSRDEGFSSWSGTSGNVPVFLSAPLALGGLPHRPTYDDWSETAPSDGQGAA